MTPRVFHARSTLVKQPLLKPNVIAFRDTVHRKTHRQLRAFQDSNQALADYFAQRLSRIVPVDRIEETATDVYIYLKAVLPVIRKNALEKLKVRLYAINSVTEKINGWCTTMSGMLISADCEPYQSVQELTFLEYVKGRLVTFVGVDNTKLQMSF